MGRAEVAMDRQTRTLMTMMFAIFFNVISWLLRIRTRLPLPLHQSASSRTTLFYVSSVLGMMMMLLLLLLLLFIDQLISDNDRRTVLGLQAAKCSSDHRSYFDTAKFIVIQGWPCLSNKTCKT